mgnify:CR=1 FL=1
MLSDLSMDEINKILKEYDIDSNKFELYVNYIIDSYKMNLKHTIESTLTTFKHYKKDEWKYPIGSIVRIKKENLKKFITEWDPRETIHNERIPFSEDTIGIIRYQYEDYEGKAVEVYFHQEQFEFWAENVPTEFLSFVFEDNIVPVGTLVYVFDQGQWVKAEIVISDIAPLYQIEITNSGSRKWINLNEMIIHPYESMGEYVHQTVVSDSRKMIYYPHLLIYKDGIALPENLIFSAFNSDRYRLINSALIDLMGNKYYKKRIYSFDFEYVEKFFNKYCRKHNLIIKWDKVDWIASILLYKNVGYIKTPSNDKTRQEIEAITSQYD